MHNEPTTDTTPGCSGRAHSARERKETLKSLPRSTHVCVPTVLYAAKWAAPAKMLSDERKARQRQATQKKGKRTGRAAWNERAGKMGSKSAVGERDGKRMGQGEKERKGENRKTRKFAWLGSSRRQLLRINTINALARHLQHGSGKSMYPCFTRTSQRRRVKTNLSIRSSQNMTVGSVYSFYSKH